MSDTQGAGAGDTSAPQTPVGQLDQQLDRMVDEGQGDAPTTTPPPSGETQIPASGKPPVSPSGPSGQAQPAGAAQQQQAPAPASDAATTAVTSQERLRPDAQGNLLDAQGNVVARTGGERRLYERVQRLEHFELPTAQTQIQDLTGQLAKLEVLNNVPRQLGLNDEEAIQGLRLMHSYKKDPVATINYILTEARAAGHNMQGVGASSGADLAAIKGMIGEQLAPIVADREATQRQQEADTEAERQYNDFVTRFSDASPHEDTIARLLANDPNLSPEAAYYQLKLFVVQSGFDWSQPLKPQLEARGAGQGGNTQVAVVPPLGSGGRAGNAPVVDTSQSQSVAGADAEMGDIVKEAMIEAGMNPTG